MSKFNLESSMTHKINWNVGRREAECARSRVPHRRVMSLGTRLAQVQIYVSSASRWKHTVFELARLCTKLLLGRVWWDLYLDKTGASEVPIEGSRFHPRSRKPDTWYLIPDTISDTWYLWSKCMVGKPNTQWGTHTWWAAQIHGGLASQPASFGGPAGWPGQHVCGLPTTYG